MKSIFIIFMFFSISSYACYAPDSAEKRGVHISLYDAERDDSELKSMIDYWENYTNPLQTNWWTCKNRRFTSQDYETYIARSEDGTNLLGFICCKYFEAEPTSGHVELVAVNPYFKGNGHGTALMQYALGQFKKEGVSSVTVHVPYRNQTAQGFYEHEGFRVSGCFASPGRILPILTKKLQE